MTWYADHLFCEGRPDVLAALAETWMADAVHHVVEPLDHAWHDPGVEHGLPSGGLVVVRPIGEAGREWYGRPMVSWHDFPKGDCPAAAISVARVVGALDETRRFFPPDGFLAYLQEFAAKTASTVAYYQSFMWGGDVEGEYAWVFGKQPTALVWQGGSSVVFTPTDHTGQSAEVLVEALKPFGLELPSPYFALHTREFDWKRYAVR